MEALMPPIVWNLYRLVLTLTWFWRKDVQPAWVGFSCLATHIDTTNNKQNWLKRCKEFMSWFNRNVQFRLQGWFDSRACWCFQGCVTSCHFCLSWYWFSCKAGFLNAVSKDTPCHSERKKVSFLEATRKRKSLIPLSWNGSHVKPWTMVRGPYTWKWSFCCLVAKPYSTLCNPIDCSLPEFSVHGILQARILEWIAISFFRGSPQPRDWTCVSCIGRRVLYHYATREARSGVCILLKASPAWGMCVKSKSR